MIIEGRRYEGIEAFKARGAEDYMIAVSPAEFNGRGTVRLILCPLGQGVTHDDIRAEYESGTVGRIPFCNTYASASYLLESCYPVSWAKIPEAWRTRILYELIYYDLVHPFGRLSTQELYELRHEASRQSFRVDALNHWLLRANWYLLGVDEKGLKYELDYEHAKRIFLAVKGIQLPLDVKQRQIEKANANFIAATKGVEIAKLSVNNQLEQLRDLTYNNEKVAIDFLHQHTEDPVVKETALQALLSVLIGFVQFPKELTPAGNGDELPASTG